MVYRVFIEKKKELAYEALGLKSDLVNLLQIQAVTGVRVINRYDVENIDEKLFAVGKSSVFSEPQLDEASDEISCSATDFVFAVEYLPGQFDQRADSAAQCLQIISQAEKPVVKTAKVYVISGQLTSGEKKQIQKYVINPVESRLATMDKYDTLSIEYDKPTSVQTLDGFISLDEKGLADFIKNYGLAMDLADIKFCQEYFTAEKRNPTITEIRMIDTYWSDHCRHTTFLTTIDDVKFEDELLEETYADYLKTREFLGRSAKPQNLMDIGTIVAKFLKKIGRLQKLDESEEINACTVKIKVKIDSKEEDWLLLFKNETHNHPTEIEPFGGAATCIGGAIRDPLSGRAYVYAAMRITGAGNPLCDIRDTKVGKLPQRKIVTTAQAGYSSYGNQIGLATGQVDEIYHDGYVAKRMEIGAVIGAAPECNVVRECPQAGDVVVLLGGKTGRDGCGGATGSSKSHTVESIDTCGAEVQKGNAPEERKLQRLFRNKEASLLIKRCNDFGAGGVSVAIGELADGIEINLNAVPKKYDGLDGTELAISESQERMAVVVEQKDLDKFLALAKAENLEATVVAVVKAEPRLIMNWNGKEIVDIKRDFLNSNGAEKHISVTPEAPKFYEKPVVENFVEGYKALVKELNVCSKKGLNERFDSTIGAGSVMMPFGGKYQKTPVQAMVNKVSVEKKDTDTSSLMAWGYNPFIAEKSPFHGAYFAVVESVSKLIASGAAFEDVYLTFQEYFEKPRQDGKRWGKPLAALLGAYRAQKDLGVAAIGGKDSMSGSFEDIDVPPTLVSFAVTCADSSEIVSPELKEAGHGIYLIKADKDKDGLPTAASLIANYNTVTALMRKGTVVAAYTPTYGGVAEGVYKMAIGNGIGVKFVESLSDKELFAYNYGGFILETTKDIAEGVKIGETTTDGKLTKGKSAISLAELTKEYENTLESVYPCNIQHKERKIETVSYLSGVSQKSKLTYARPKVLIPVFPGTNCEYDTAKAMERAGAEAEIFVINTLSATNLSESVAKFAAKIRNSQIIFIPGGFSGGDEPDGSGKFITAFFRNAEIKDEVHKLLKQRDGLMCGICNGFQALIKLGLVTYGEIVDIAESDPTLTFNTINRHQSKLVRTRIASNLSPWLSRAEVGDVYTVPISHGEGRFLANDEWLSRLIKNGQIATQYVDLDGKPTFEVEFNPNDSVMAIEGITSPDGRVLGKMAHSERIGKDLYKNVQGNYDTGLFEAAVDYYK